MSVEVFQWKVLPEARREDEVCDRYSQIMRGDAATVAQTISEASAWDLRGLVLQKVAEVDGDDKNMAFERTNHIDRAWTENEGLTVMGNGQWRSTSMGDLMRVNGELFVVASMGFDRIDAILAPPTESSSVVERVRG